MKETIREIYDRVMEEASGRQLDSVIRVLPFIREAMTQKIETARSDSAHSRFESVLTHSLETAEMLLNLHLAISREEEDTLIAAVILHVYPENYSLKDLEKRLEGELDLRPEICALVETILPEQEMTDEELQDYYQRIQENPLALLAVLADRGNIVQNLYRFSKWNAYHCITETKVWFFPMCIYGKEHYHELLAPISVLMGKLKSLIEVSEILLHRYEAREAELIQDILSLREENATIRGIIAKFRQEEVH